MLPTAADRIESVEGAPFPGEDIFGRLAPDERFGLGVVMSQVFVDRGLEIIDAGVASPAYLPCRDRRKEALDEVQPGCALLPQ